MKPRNEVLALFGRASETYPGRTGSQAAFILWEIKKSGRKGLFEAFRNLQDDTTAVKSIVKAANTRHNQTENKLVKNKPITKKMARGVLALEATWMQEHRGQTVRELEELLTYLEGDEAKALRQAQKEVLLATLELR